MVLTEVREAVIALLKADADVQAIFGTIPCRIYNNAPTGAAYPYAEVRVLTDVPMGNIARTGNDMTITVDVYASSTMGDSVVEEAGDVIKAALHTEALTVSGLSPFYMAYEFGGLVGGSSDSQHYTSRYRIMCM